MSNALAIASVSRALLDLLNEGIINNNVAATLGQTVTVTALPPDRVRAQQPAGPDPTQLNIYLYRVAFNAAWRQSDLPTRDSRGNLTSVPLLPLDLHYLLTSFGSTDLHSEILMGYAMQLLYENPVLTRAALRNTLTAASMPQNVLPTAYQALRAADLAEQVELVKLTPDSMSMDEMSKIWTAMQTQYRMSTSYQASVVLIESRRAKRTPLPVLTRGQFDAATGRDEGVTVFPDLSPGVPTIVSVTPPKEQQAARLGDLVTIEGFRLDAPAVFARIVEARSQQALELPVSVSGTSATIQLPSGPGLGGADPTRGDDPDNWRVAVYNVSFRLPGGPPSGEHVTNELPLVIAPKITAVSAVTNADTTTFTVKCAPKIRASQNVTLVVGSRELSVEAIAQPETDTVLFVGKKFTSGAEWVRLRVDGIESLLVDRSVTPPAFSVTDRVVIP